MQLKTLSHHAFEITGEHDIDEKWLENVRHLNDQVKIVPRIIFESWSQDQFRALFENIENLYKFVNYIADFIEKHQFDGIVLELWSQLGGNFKE